MSPLEIRVRRLERINVALIGLLLGVGLVAAAPGKAGKKSADPPIEQTVKTRMLMLVDEQDRPRGLLGCDEEGCSLSLLDSKGHILALLDCAESGVARMGVSCRGSEKAAGLFMVANPNGFGLFGKNAKAEKVLIMRGTSPGRSSEFGRTTKTRRGSQWRLSRAMPASGLLGRRKATYSGPLLS